MWRRFSASSTENSPPKLTTNNLPPPPPPPSTPVTATPKPATSLAQTSAKPPVVPTSPVKEHDLPIQRPPGAGQRRRSSIMERLTRESTKEGMTRHMILIINRLEQNMIHYIP